MAPKHSQLISLEPDKADLLDKLARKTGTPKQVLLREAVDDLLARRGIGNSEAYDRIREALKHARAIVVRFESRNDEYIWARKCFTARREIDEILEQMDDAED